MDVTSPSGAITDRIPPIYSQTEIDEKIRFHEAIILSLKTEWNKRALISRLPDEILERVFEFVILERRPSRFVRGSSPSDYSWTRVSRVCSHWRRVAIDHPGLWGSLIDYRNVKWAVEMLKRSKAAPLDAVWAYIIGNTNYPNFWDHISRIRELFIYIHYSSSISVPEDLMLNHNSNLAAPLLEELNISISCSESDSGCMLPTHLFADGSTPSLRRLKFQGCAPSWSSSFLDSTITTLSVDLFYMGVGATAPPSQVLLALGNMPNLRSLTLIKVTSVTQNPTPVHTIERTIPLLQLAQLTIKHNVDDASLLLNHLLFPPDIEINIWVKSAGNSPDFSNIYPTLSYLKPTGPFRLVCEVESSLITLEVCALSHGTEIVGRADEENPCIVVDMSMDRNVDEGMLESVLNSSLACLPLEQLVELSWSSDLDARVWGLKLQEWFGDLPSLRTIEVTGNGCGITDALSRTSQAAGRDNRPLYFPHVRRLSLIGWDLHAKQGEMIHQLRACLTKRLDYGMQIEQLHVETIQTISVKEQKPLTRLVGVASWEEVS